MDRVLHDLHTLSEFAHEDAVDLFFLRLRQTDARACDRFVDLLQRRLPLWSAHRAPTLLVAAPGVGPPRSPCVPGLVPAERGPPAGVPPTPPAPPRVAAPVPAAPPRVAAPVPAAPPRVAAPVPAAPPRVAAPAAPPADPPGPRPEPPAPPRALAKPRVTPPDVKMFRAPPDADLHAARSHLARLRVLVCATQCTGFGGSATNAYNIARFLRREYGTPAACVFFEGPDYKRPERYDPLNLGGVFRMPRWTRGPKLGRKDEVVRAQYRRDLVRAQRDVERYLGGPPELILCKNYVAPLQAKVMYPDAPLVYLVSGSKHATQLLKTYAELVAEYPRAELATLIPAEVEANMAATAIVTNSVASYRVFHYVYESAFGAKLTAPINTSLASELLMEEKSGTPTPALAAWSARQYDVAFVVSSCTRAIKGCEIARQVLHHPALADRAILVVGDHSESFAAPNVTTLGHQTNRAVLELLGQSRVVISPSIFDASPNLVSEAIGAGARVVVTPNVGNAENYHADYVLPDVRDVDAWAARVDLLLTRPEGDNPPVLLPSAPPSRAFGDDFAALLAQLAQP